MIQKDITIINFSEKYIQQITRIEPHFKHCRFRQYDSSPVHPDKWKNKACYLDECDLLICHLGRVVVCTNLHIEKETTKPPVFTRGFVVYRN